MTANGCRSPLGVSASAIQASVSSVSIQRHVRSSAAAARRPSSCCGPSGSSTTSLPSRRGARFPNIGGMMNDDVGGHRGAEKAELLLAAARYLNETLELERVYDRFHQLLTDAVPHNGVIVSSFDAETQLISCDYAWVDGGKLDPAILPPLSLNREGGMQSRVIMTGEPLLQNDVPEQVKDPAGVYYDVDREGHMRKLPDEG